MCGEGRADFDSGGQPFFSAGFFIPTSLATVARIVFLGDKVLSNFRNALINVGGYVSEIQTNVPMGSLSKSGTNSLAAR